MSLLRGVVEVWYSVRGVRCIGFVSREGSGRESMNAFIPVDEATFDDRWPLNRGSRSRRRAGSSGRIRLGACHNPRRDGDDQQSSFRIPSREVDHSSASGRWVRGGGLVMFLGTSRPRPEIPADVSFMHFARAFLPLRWHFVEANLDRYVRFPTARKFTEERATSIAARKSAVRLSSSRPLNGTRPRWFEDRKR